MKTITALLLLAGGLLALLTASCSQPPQTLRLGSVPLCQGCLPAYAAIKWRMEIHQIGTDHVLSAAAAVFPSQSDCEQAALGIGNPDAYAVCTPNGA